MGFAKLPAPIARLRPCRSECDPRVSWQHQAYSEDGAERASRNPGRVDIGRTHIGITSRERRVSQNVHADRRGSTRPRSPAPGRSRGPTAIRTKSRLSTSGMVPLAGPSVAPRLVAILSAGNRETWRSEHGADHVLRLIVTPLPEGFDTTIRPVIVYGNSWLCSSHVLRTERRTMPSIRDEPQWPSPCWLNPAEQARDLLLSGPVPGVTDDLLFPPPECPPMYRDASRRSCSPRAATSTRDDSLPRRAETISSPLALFHDPAVRFRG